MNFLIKALEIFKTQVEGLDKKSRQIIYDKVQLIKENPYRYKKIHSKHYSKVFRIRINIKSKETRLIYAIIEPNVILVCLLDRKKDYKDLEKYLAKIK
jgi:mRNA-degrading endonuclease RelE of RelBE toxin-antitoxin system